MVVLPLLDHTDLAMLSRAGTELRALVVASGLPRAGVDTWLELGNFVGSVARLAWAGAHGGPLDASGKWGACARAARVGKLDMLQWAREHGCRWDATVCELRRAAWAHGCVAVGAAARLPVG